MLNLQFKILVGHWKVLSWTSLQELDKGHLSSLQGLRGSRRWLKGPFPSVSPLLKVQCVKLDLIYDFYFVKSWLFLSSLLYKSKVHKCRRTCFQLAAILPRKPVVNNPAIQTHLTCAFCHLVGYSRPQLKPAKKKVDEMSRFGCTSHSCSLASSRGEWGWAVGGGEEQGVKQSGVPNVTTWCHCTIFKMYLILHILIIFHSYTITHYKVWNEIPIGV